MNRNDIKKTPGKVVIDQAGANVHLYSSDGITAELMEETVTLTTDRDGTWDEVPIGRLVQVKMKPTQYTAAALASIFTHGAVLKGGSILASTDKTLDIHTIDGFRRRIPNAFVQAEPAMNCKTGSTILGEVTWYGIVPLNGDAGVLASFYNKTSAAWSDTTWDPENELTPGWDCSWSLEGSPSNFDVMDTQGGVTFTPKSTLDEDKSDRSGLLNITLRDYGIEIKASCLNISEDLVLAAIGWGNRLGSKKGSLGRDFKMRATDGTAFITAYNAVLQQPYNFRMAADRTVVADLNWATRPRYTTGAHGAHLLVTTEDPDAEE